MSLILDDVVQLLVTGLIPFLRLSADVACRAARLVKRRIGQN